MYDSSLFDNLKLINKDDWKEFRLFVDSDFNNRGSYKEETRWLCDYISGVYPDFQHKKLKKEKVLSALFKDKPVISGKLEKIMHELNTMCRNYLIWKSQNSEENSFYRDLEWLKILRESLDEDRYLLFMEKARKKFNAIEKVSPEYYYQKYLLEKEWHEWLSTVNRVRDDLNFPEVLNSLLDFYHLTLFIYSSFILTQKKFTKIEISNETITTLHNLYIQNKYNSKNILINIYSTVLKLLMQNKLHPKDVLEFTNVLNNFESKIDYKTLQILYVNLRNFCTFTIEDGHIEMNSILHNLHKEHLSAGYLYENGNLSSTAFLNINKMALINQKYDWCLEFIESHKDKIINETNDLVFYKTNLAMYYFSLNNFEKSLSLSQINSKNIIYNIYLKVIEIKCYYELKSDLLQYKLDAFKMYITRLSAKFLSVEFKNRHLIFFNILNQITETRPHDNKKINKITTKLENSRKVIEFMWLKEKIHLLKK